MNRFLAATAAACILVVTGGGVSAAAAQTWNDPRTLELVGQATARRAQQLADSGLADYQATAHGYVTFLAQLGEGFATPPKIIKADELELQVYWHAPNESKQIIVGRRDTTLLPTDINYHRDHLGIAQNNFPNTIRIGDGDEVADTPHPLSPIGLREYDYALSDSFAIGIGAQRIHVYEVKVRPKDDKQPRVVGAVYIDPAEQQVVRMNLSFTRAALLDKSLEDLSIVLENRLVAGRYWLPSRQELEIRRTGTWLDYPVRGIIRGRWEIGDYKFNLNIPQTTFRGPEIVQASPEEIKKYPWAGKILDSLPPDVRAVEDEDVQRVKDEARALVRAQALARPAVAEMSARNLSDFVRFNRVEGLAIGDGLSQQFGNGMSGVVRARYGLDDEEAMGTASLEWTNPQTGGFSLFVQREMREAGDGPERSTAINSLAAQEFGSDYSDPYLARGGGVRLNATNWLDLRWHLEAAVEDERPLAVHATPVRGRFAPTLPVWAGRVARVDLRADRAPSLWIGGTELTAYADARWTGGLDSATNVAGFWGNAQSVRGAAMADVERPVGRDRVISRTTIAGLWSSGPSYPIQDLIFLGGPVSAPGYDFHSLVSRTAATEHLEWQLPIPFVPFSLGRFGRVPSEATLAPYLHDVYSVGGTCAVVHNVLDAGFTPDRRCDESQRGFHPSWGIGFLSPFNLVRFDIAHGVGRGGAWIFSFDVDREFWSIL